MKLVIFISTGMCGPTMAPGLFCLVDMSLANGSVYAEPPTIGLTTRSVGHFSSFQNGDRRIGRHTAGGHRARSARQRSPATFRDGIDRR